MNLEQLEATLKPLLKKLGYRKRNLTWYKNYAETTVIFSIQKSMYGSDVWYYCFGVDILGMEGSHGNTIIHCQVLDRYDQVENGLCLIPEKLVRMIQFWDSRYGTIHELQARLSMGEMPKMTYGTAIMYLAIGLGVPEASFASMTKEEWKAYYRNSVNLVHAAS